jgi:hypothetical protein
MADGYQYFVAWTIFGLSGLACCIFWWKVTSFIKRRVWRDLHRGIVVVLIFTPWYVGDFPEFYAPAVVVLLMDVLLEGAKSGLKGGTALLVSTFLMLLVLTIRQFLFNKPRSL